MLFPGPTAQEHTASGWFYVKDRCEDWTIGPYLVGPHFIILGLTVRNGTPKNIRACIESCVSRRV